MGLNELPCFWIFVLVACVNGNHFPSGSPLLRSLTSSSVASAGATSGGAGSSAWSAAGSGLRRFQGVGPVSSRSRGFQRGAGRGNVLILSSARNPARVISQRRAPLFIVGGTSRRTHPPNIVSILGRGHGSAAPPGVQFISGSGRGGGRASVMDTLVMGGAQAYHGSQAPMLYVDGANLGGISGLGGPLVLPTGPPQPFALDASAIGSQIPGIANKLTIKGQTTTGDLILSGPGGTITIGAEVLNGISNRGRGMRMTEFEEMEVEGDPRLRGNGSTGLKLTSATGQSLILQGKETILPAHGFHSAPTNHGAVHTGGVGDAIVIGGSSSSASSSSGSASASASAMAGSSQTSASASARSNAIVSDNQSTANTNNSAGVITVLSGSGQNERVLQLGQNEGKTQVITLGGSTAIQTGAGGSGIEVPGNATVIIGG